MIIVFQYTTREINFHDYQFEKVLTQSSVPLWAKVIEREGKGIRFVCSDLKMFVWINIINIGF